jgi:hypothetical protein
MKPKTAVTIQKQRQIDLIVRFAWVDSNKAAASDIADGSFCRVK